MQDHHTADLADVMRPVSDLAPDPDPWAERCREATRAVEAPEYPEARERWFRDMLKGGTCDL